MGSQLLTHQHHDENVILAKPETPTRVSLWRRLGHAMAWVALSRQIRRERRQLAHLSEHELRDIGVTRAQADNESFKGISSIPPNRLKPTRFRRR